LAIGWSPTEQKLAFISPPENEPSASANYYGPLHLFDAETGEVSILTDEIVLAFFWSPGGESIAYFTLTQGAGEQVAMTAIDDGSSSHGKRQQQHDDLLLSLSTIGVSGGQPNHLVDFQPTELFVTQFLPFFDQYALSHRLWSPMSDALVLPIVDQEVAKIFVVPTNGRGLRYVADGVMAFWSPQ
jgi:TolB protein